MMGPMSLRAIAEACNADYVGEDIIFTGVCIDSRLVKAGDLFVAIRGDRFDGHNYLAEVESAGAKAVVLEKKVDGCRLPQVRVENTVIALGILAALNRAAFKGKVIALTGSAGKTTTKEMIAAILLQTESTLVTEGNLNNHIGVPLTLLRLTEKHASAVIEMGASGLEEIHYLSSLVKPDVALVTNVAAAHIVGFGSIENVARGKREIFDGLKSGGVAIVNSDNSYTSSWKAELATRFSVLSYSIETEADLFAVEIKQTPAGVEFILCTHDERHGVMLGFMGRHNVSNALAAAACCYALGKSLKEIVHGLQRAQPYKGRLQRKLGLRDCLVIDDSYNANPASVQMAIDSLMACSGKRVLVLGDMAELGHDAEQMHHNIGVYARASGVKTLLVCGVLSKNTALGFGVGAENFQSWESLAERCISIASPEIVFLIKGSRSAGMERVVNALVTSVDIIEKEKTQC